MAKSTECKTQIQPAVLFGFFVSGLDWRAFGGWEKSSLSIRSVVHALPVSIYVSIYLCICLLCGGGCAVPTFPLPSRWKVLAPFCALWARYGFYLYGHACCLVTLFAIYVYHFRNAFSTQTHPHIHTHIYCFLGDVNLNVLRSLALPLHRMLFCLAFSVSFSVFVSLDFCFVLFSIFCLCIKLNLSSQAGRQADKFSVISRSKDIQDMRMCVHWILSTRRPKEKWKFIWWRTFSEFSLNWISIITHRLILSE